VRRIPIVSVATGSVASDTADMPLYGAIEGGGSKFVCAVATAPDRMLDSTSIPTSDAPTTLAKCVQFFVAAEKKHGPIAAFGFACFGPIELRSEVAGFGRMMATPKTGWSGVNVLEPLRSAFDVPIELDTDVGAAAFAEWRLGAGRGLGSVAYVTVGTGIGGAIAPLEASAGRLMHAEMGHLPVRRDPRDQGFTGVCPFHGDCLEGLASGPAIRARWGCTLDALTADHIGSSVIGGYLGQLAASIALIASAERIVFGGGVMSNGALLPLIRTAAINYLNGYLEPLTRPERSADYICEPALGINAGITGSLLLAMRAHRQA
jgi:fructokinase